MTEKTATDIAVERLSAITTYLEQWEVRRSESLDVLDLDSDPEYLKLCEGMEDVLNAALDESEEMLYWKAG